jgi:Dolichyl-phosphate-mannose-protein mannosyltransferase
LALVLERFRALSDAQTAALISAVVLGIAVLTVSPFPVGLYFDDGIYAILGKALATGQGLHYLNLPGQPAATHYPPGYPLFLSLLWRLSPGFPGNAVVFRLANAVLLAVAAAFAFRLALERLPLGRPGAALAAVVGTVVSPALLLVTAVLSETLFLALLILTLWAAERTIDDPTAGRVIGVGVLIGALALTRTLGVVVLPAVAVLLFWRRARWQALLLLATGLLFLVPWQIWVASHGGEVPPELRGNYGAYGPWLMQGLSAEGPGFVARVALRNLQAIGLELQPSSAPGMPDVVRGAIGATALLVVAVGASAAWRRAPATVVSLAGYMLVVAIWPFAPFRFLWAVWTPLVLLGAVGIGVLIRWRPEHLAWRPLRPALVAGALLAFAGQGLFVARSLAGKEWWSALPQARSAELLPVAQWVATHTAPDDVVVTDHGAANLVYLYTGRRALPAEDPLAAWYLRYPTATYQAAYVSRVLDRFRVRFLVVTGASELQTAARLANGPAPQLRFVERLPVYGAAFAVIGEKEHD